MEVDEEEINKLGIGLMKADIISETEVIHHNPEKLSRAVMRMVYSLHSKGDKEFYSQDNYF